MINEQQNNKDNKKSNLPKDAVLFDKCGCDKLSKPTCIGTIYLPTKEFKPKENFKQGL